MSRKQQLLKRHRRTKRIALLIGLLVLIAAGVLVAWWLPLILAVVLWAAHEAWFADHLFYSPSEDYAYAFPHGSEVPGLRLDAGRLLLDAPLAADDTLIVGIELHSSWLGRFIDPAVELLGLQTPDRQVFERGVGGRRYLNLTGAADALAAGKLRVRGRFCRINGQPTLWRFRQPDYRQQRVMVIAPHADDAELAAFSLYSQAAESWIVTLTAGEIEAEHYQQMGLPKAQAAQLKGRLRAWDSIAVPRWAGVPEAQCVQLGYFCMQLAAMQAAPDQAQASREAQLSDTRLFRQFNAFALPGDVDGAPTWHTLIADLRALLLKARPQVIVLPTPLLDPHADHICAHAAILEALEGLAWQPDTLLGYANHLHDNDRWPMGDSGAGVALPPRFDTADELVPCSFTLALSQQQDKAMALGMMHDLQPRAPFKRRVRRWLQQVLAGRSPSPYGENEFFRKAVRRHELLWVLKQD
ncbi:MULTISPECIES: PIG-L deacetylase family protein [unclassified Pseudomonas]|jgi:LmbE family N-acetylglucosaminyl deacetylase|uniref:PIG-L deacetylase family protein n=1 Tax=unclassified Pseudomonas TaxID=196821 RepID=UPI000C87A4E7|nr:MULTISPECIES: PIG-L family deacetylase [unclassified Pseudomonas]PMU93953.1 PIG-L family deacetylase [Pseudomonas sp. GW704-F3]PMU96977.1 PIG-L family deacetylase [Pseudomonas sp. GW704-F5]PMV08421.1 PIG-L family deacetylase [Pseudomonas sp. MPBD4-3]PMV35045.1 PIG-L family deacetylase [Pseudomonas sp. GW704-F2]